MDFDIVTYKRGSDMLAPAELKKVHPLGKSPVISLKPTPTHESIVIAESGLIFEYCCEYFAQELVPKRYKEGQEGKCGGETEQWLRYRFFMHYAEGSLMTLLLIALIMDRAFAPFIPRCLVSDLANAPCRDQDLAGPLLHQTHYARRRHQGGRHVP